jgi:hypothetical protein
MAPVASATTDGTIQGAGDLVFGVEPQGEFVGERASQAADLEVRTHPGQDLGFGEGFGDVIDRALGKAAYLVVGRLQRSHEDDGYFRPSGIGLEAGEHLEAVQPGHHDIQQDEVGEGVFELTQGARAVLGHEQSVALRAEGLEQEPQVGRGVVHDEYRIGRGAHGLAGLPESWVRRWRMRSI